MNLPAPSPAYDVNNEAAVRRALEQEDRRNLKRDADLDVGTNKLIRVSPNGTRWNITVADDGSVSAVAV